MKRYFPLIQICFFTLFFSAVATAQTTLIATGTSWKYLDNGSNQGTAWYGTAFNDASWASGNAQLGYGDGDEATVVSYGSNSSAKYITTYFRKTISVADASLFSNYTLNVKRDDGVIVYINGVEKYRNNMPTGSITYTTGASTTCSDDGATFQTATLTSGSLVTGTNVIAVEMHQVNGSSSDISFDLSLIGNPAGGGATLTRGPYLQKGTSTGVIVRWRSNIATNSTVKYGLTAANLNLTASNASSVTEHEIQLSGLSANTKYYYSIGSSTQTLQGDANNFFVTAPTIGTTKKTNVWITGDCGNNSTNQANVRNRYATYMGSNYTDVWLLLGDNAYDAGTDTEYQSKFFDVYKDDMLKKTVLWPATGNHDYANNASRQNDHNVPYYSNFTLPANAEAGGVASNTEAFYSFNYANIHFISLDSYGKESNTYRLYDTLGPQVTWLKQDLAANTQLWTVVYWHHPPYTMGSHNSDTESDLVSIRQNLIRILERYKVDLILCGHSHVYERSRLMKGHYGNESSFNAGTNNLSTSSAKYDGSANSCPYVKNTSTPFNGTVYVVAGSAGQLGGTQSSFPHAAMYFSNATNGGSLALTIEENRLDGKWVCADGVIRDQFTIEKNVNKTTNVAITAGQNTVLTASWVGNYTWSPGGATTRSITVSPGTSTTYTVTDGLSCLTDVFNVTVSSPRIATGITEQQKDLSMIVYPNPFSGHTTIEVNTSPAENLTLQIFDVAGKQVGTLSNSTYENGKHRFTLDATEFKLTTGIYYVRLQSAHHALYEKIILTGN
jgi:acid phosphatase type 7